MPTMTRPMPTARRGLGSWMRRGAASVPSARSLERGEEPGQDVDHEAEAGSKRGCDEARPARRSAARRGAGRCRRRRPRSIGRCGCARGGEPVRGHRPGPCRHVPTGPRAAHDGGQPRERAVGTQGPIGDFPNGARPRPGRSSAHDDRTANRPPRPPAPRRRPRHRRRRERPRRLLQRRPAARSASVSSA